MDSGLLGKIGQLQWGRRGAWWYGLCERRFQKDEVSGHLANGVLLVPHKQEHLNGSRVDGARFWSGLIHVFPMSHEK